MKTKSHAPAHVRARDPDASADPLRLLPHLSAGRQRHLLTEGELT
jgi:hypothetical protein